MRKPFRADLHLHTRHSTDSLATPQSVLEAAAKKGLCAIAVTDHNEISGALEAKRIAARKKLRLQVIVGEEVMADEGDLLVYFVKRRIKPGPLAGVLAEVKRQGAICCAAHPYDFTRSGIKLESLPAKTLAGIHAIEAFNARVSVQSHNAAALEFAKQNGKAQLAGSDAHHPSEVGAAHVDFLGVGRLTRQNILSARRKIAGHLSPKYVHAYSRYAVLKRRLEKAFGPQP